MAIALIENILELSFIVVALFYALRCYAVWRKSFFGFHVDLTLRTRIIFVLVMLTLGFKVSEDAITKESAPYDHMILTFVHQTIPESSLPFFRLISATGSFWVISSISLAASTFFVLKKRLFEAVIVALSGVFGGVLVFAVKAIVRRDRPLLWETSAVWTTSFPSGHTAGTACLASALVIGISRVWPSATSASIFFATAWVGLVALSRMVLGVHWPTDVLAAASLGVCIPLFVVLLSRRFLPQLLNGVSGGS